MSFFVLLKKSLNGFSKEIFTKKFELSLSNKM
jgi:hypothetical protein